MKSYTKLSWVSATYQSGPVISLDLNWSRRRCSWTAMRQFVVVFDSFRSILRLVNYVKMEDDNTVELNLRPTDLPDTASADLSYSIRALCTRYHPFYEYSRGWVSLEPSATRSIYGLDCVIMQPSDVIMVSPPIGERTDVYGRNIWNGVDLTVNSVFATYCARVSEDHWCPT